MESFRIRNIKSFADSSEIVVKPITVFVGRNSCGKSSLLRFPAVLAQTANTMTDSPIRFYGDMVDYGYYEDVKYKGNDEKISFALMFRADLELSIFPFFAIRSLSTLPLEWSFDHRKEPYERDIVLRVTVDKPKKTLTVDKVELFLGDMCLYEICRTDNDSYAFLGHYRYEDKVFIKNDVRMDIHISKIGFDTFIPTFETEDAISSIYKSLFGRDIDAEKLEALIKLLFEDIDSKGKDKLEEEDEAVIEVWKQLSYYASLLGRIYNSSIREFRNIKYIGPFRENPSRIYRDPEYNSNGVGVHGENTSNELIRAYRKDDSKLIDNISKWTKRALGSEITLKEINAGLFQIMLKNQQGVETNLIDNGYGMSQVLPIVTEVMKLQNIDQSKRTIPFDRILLLEQPELHLHPAAQSELADLFVDCVLTGNGNNKILIETHSEHLIRKLQVLIASAECPLTKDMVRIYYVDKNEDGSSFVEEMVLLENGKFETQWPSGFFDKGYLLSRELARAGIRD